MRFTKVESSQPFQNIERLCFSKNGVLREEFTFLLQSLFSKAEQHISILETLSTKNKGLTRNEIVSAVLARAVFGSDDRGRA